MARYANSQFEPPVPSYLEIKYRVPREQAMGSLKPESEQRIEMAKGLNFLSGPNPENDLNLDPFFLPHPSLLSSPEEKDWLKRKKPIILSIKGKSLNPTTAEVEFETDDETKSEIEYGIAEDYGMRMEGTWNLKHRFILPGVKEGIYHFKVKAKDRDGNEVESLDQSLEVEGLIPPIFKDLFEEERELRPSFGAKGKNGWISKEGSWWSKWGKLFPYFSIKAQSSKLTSSSKVEEANQGRLDRQKGKMAFIITGEQDWKDYSVELKVRPDYNQSKIAIALRYNPENESGCYLWIEQINQRRRIKDIESLNYNLTLEKRTMNGTSLLHQTFYKNSLRWFIIEFMVDGDKIEVSIDGKKMIKLKDPEIGKGQIALISEEKLPLTVIDDFVVRPIGKKGMFSSNPQPIAQDLNSINSESNPHSQIPDLHFSITSKGPNGNSFDPLELYEPSYSSTPEPDPIYQTTTSLPLAEIVYYYHHDHLGNIRAVTDQAKNVIERHDFYPFGEEITNPLNKDSYLFTGKERDSETALDYFGARYYSPSLCRFLSVDPSPGYIADTRTLNPYIYAANNPLVYTDRDGEAVVIVAVAIGAGIGGLINGTAEALTEYMANPNASFKDLAKAFGAGFAGGAAGTVVGTLAGELNPLLGIKIGQGVESLVTQLLKEGKVDLAEVGLEMAMAIPGGKIVLITRPTAPGRPIEKFMIRKFKNWEKFLKWLKKPGTKLYLRQQWHENLIMNAPSFTGKIFADTFWYYRQWGLYLWLMSISSAWTVHPTVTTEVEINWIKTLGRAQR